MFKESKGYIFYTFFILPGSQTEIVSDHARDDREKYENYRERSQIRVSNTAREERERQREKSEKYSETEKRQTKVDGEKQSFQPRMDRLIHVHSSH